MALYKKIERGKPHVFFNLFYTMASTMAAKEEDEKKQFNRMIDTMYQTTANASCVLKRKDSKRFFHALTSWCLEHLVACYEKDGEWFDVEWQKSSIIGYHCHWTGDEYVEDDE